MTMTMMILASATSAILAWKTPLAIIFLALLAIRLMMLIPERWIDFDWLVEFILELAMICIAVFYGAVYLT